MSKKTTKIVQDRLSELTAQRSTVQAQLRVEMERKLMPIDAAIAELKLLLARLDGGGTVPQPTRDSSAVPSPSGPQDVVLSPKSKTPVPSNTAVLRRALRGK